MKEPKYIERDAAGNRGFVAVIAIFSGLIGVALLVNMIENEIAKNLMPIVAVSILGCIGKLIRNFRNTDQR